MEMLRVRSAVSPLRRPADARANPVALLPRVDDLVANLRPEDPVHCLRPAVLAETAREFRDADEAKASPLAEAIFSLDGVRRVFLGGDFLTVIAYVPAGGSIPSLTPLFRAADWPERVPITDAEVEVCERWFADLFDELFGVDR